MSCTPSALLRADTSDRAAAAARSIASIDVGVEQLAQLGVADQLAQLRLIDRQRLRPALGERRVAVVEEARDVAEEQRRGKRRRLSRNRPSRRGSCGCGCRRASRPAPACRRNRAGTRDTFRAAPETIRTATRPPAGRRRACAAARAARACPGRRFGSSSERAAFSRNFAANSAVAPSCRTTSACTSSGSGSSSRGSGGSSTSGNRTTNPSSPQSVSTSMPVSSRIFAAAAIAHGAWMRPPRGDRTQTRQSPSSSRTRSMTIVAASGTAPRGRHLIARDTAAGSRPRSASRSCSRVSRSTAAAGGRRSRSCISRPMARPSSSGRPAPIAFPERHLARFAGRGRDEHAIVGDLLDPPRRGAEHEGFADRRLEDHLFVELADARRAGTGADAGTRRTDRGRESCRRWRSRRASRLRARRRCRRRDPR